MKIQIDLSDIEYGDLKKTTDESGISIDLFVKTAIRKKITEMTNELKNKKNAFDHILKLYQLNPSQKIEEGVEDDRFCPIDEHKLTKIKIENIVIDYCSHCFGIWFDYGELEQLLKKDVHKIGNAGETHPDYGDDALEKKCPACESQLYKKEYPNADLHLDLCKTCGGIWLDGGEFAVIYSDIQRNHLKDIFSEVIKNYIDIGV